MRQVQLWVDRDYAGEVRARAMDAGATHAVRVPVKSEHGAAELLIVSMPNDRFGRVLDAVEPVESLHVSFQRDSTILLEPPADGLEEQVSDVSMRGPLEILIEGLQSLGGWSTYLAYAAIAGAVVWVGMVSNTIFLLTAAMLIAPFAAPAMTSALATARGDAHLLRRSVGRYLAGVATSVAMAAFLSLVTGLSELTHLMVEVANVSAWSLLLPVAAGVAGALSFASPDRTSLASGAGVGMLVALALAPQAGLIGIGLVLGEARIVSSAAFVVAIQLLGINAAATAVFLLLGVRRRVPRARSGSATVRALSMGVTGVALIGMLTLQVGTYPALERETVITQAEAAVMAFLDEHPEVLPVDATARFPHAATTPEDLLVVEARVVRTRNGIGALDGAALSELVRKRLLAELPAIDPLVGIAVLTDG